MKSLFYKILIFNLLLISYHSGKAQSISFYDMKICLNSAESADEHMSDIKFIRVSTKYINDGYLLSEYINNLKTVTVQVHTSSIFLQANVLTKDVYLKDKIFEDAVGDGFISITTNDSDDNRKFYKKGNLQLEIRFQKGIYSIILSRQRDCIQC